ncbi:MAG: hypothetical protein ABIC39_05110 [Pseudomonadota bacterium]
MGSKCLAKSILAAVIVIGISAGLAHADETTLQDKLSKDLSVNLDNVTIAEALDKIGKKAGVEFVFSDEAEWKLPYGKSTRLSVQLDGPLAESFNEMLDTFFMRYAVGDKAVTIYPRPELEHILGRPTTKQLELLKAIYTSPIYTYVVDQEQKTINDALGQQLLISPIELQAKLNNMFRQLVGKDQIVARTTRGGRGRSSEPLIIKEATESEEAEILMPTPVTLAQLLSQAGFGTWYIPAMEFSGQVPEIRSIGTNEFQQAKLDQVLDISYKDERADMILQKLAGRTGMQLRISKKQSSWLKEEISVDMQNIKLSQAILNVVNTVNGEVRIAIDDNYIYISGPVFKEPLAGKPGEKAEKAGYVGKISIPMDEGKYFVEFMLRESDLTEELKAMRDMKMKEILGKEDDKPTAGKNEEKGEESQ